MIVVGVDPGAVETGVAIADTRSRRLLGSATFRRGGTWSGAQMVEVPPEYVEAVVAGVLAAIGDDGDPPELLVVEAVKRPSWRVAGKVKPTDPSAIIATAVVFGALLGRSWRVPLVSCPVGQNGSRPFGHYPDALVSAAERRRSGWELFPAGDGQLRHERSAYDVAMSGPARLSLARQSGRIYA